MNKWDALAYEQEIIKRLNNGEKVYLESGAANEKITAYEKDDFGNTIFTTTAYAFPKKVNLRNYDGVDMEMFEGELSVTIW